MMNDGHGVTSGGTNGPASAQKIDLVVRVDSTTHVKGQVKIQQATVGTSTQHDALLSLRLGASFIWGHTGGAADGPILAGQLVREQFLSRGVGGDFLVGQERQQTLLKGAEAPFDLSFSLRAGRDQMGDAQCCEGTLELRTGIAPIGSGLMAEEGQAVSIEGERQAMSGKGAAKVLEMVPSGVGGDENSPHKLARMIVDRQEEGLLVRRRPPLVDRRIVLPEFAHLCALPSPSRPGCWGRCVDQQWEVTAGIGGDGFAVALKGKASGQLIGDQLVIGRSLERQEIFQEPAHIVRPGGTMVAPREVGSEGGRVSKPSGAQAKEMGAADIQKLGGAIGIELALVEGVQSLLQERQCDALK